MTDVTKLRSRADKGVPPPPPEKTNDNLSKPPRGKPAAKGKIEFSVPKHMLDEFAQEAGKRFGFKKGSKSDLFIAMWEEYKSRTPGHLS